MSLLIWRLLFDKELQNKHAYFVRQITCMYTYSVWRTLRVIKAQNRIKRKGKRKDFSPRVQSTFHSSEWKSSLRFEERLHSTQNEL